MTRLANPGMWNLRGNQGRRLLGKDGRFKLRCADDPNCCDPKIPQNCLLHAQALQLCPTAVLCNFGITEWETQQQVGQFTVVTTYIMPATVRLNIEPITLPFGQGIGAIWRNYLQGTQLNEPVLKQDIGACFNVTARCVANGCWQLLVRLHNFTFGILQQHNGFPPCSLSQPTFGGPGGIRYHRSVSSGCPIPGGYGNPVLATGLSGNCVVAGTDPATVFNSFPLTVDLA